MEKHSRVVRAYDVNGDFVTSGDALIDNNPILANQTYPFSMKIQYNPNIDKYQVEFKEFWEGTNETKRSTN